MDDVVCYQAVAKYLPVSAHKVRPVAKHIRSCSCEKAMVILDAMPQKGARFLKKALQSAIANAMDRNNRLDESSLVVSRLLVNEGPQAKRLWPRGRGKADRLIRRSSHIVVVVKEKRGK